MKTSLWSSLVATLRSWLGRLFSRPEVATLLYPECLEELVTILDQARQNGSSLKIVGDVYQFSYGREDIIVSLRHLDRLLGLDTNTNTVTVEPGMKLSSLATMLASIKLSLDLGGRVPDLTVADCLAVGGPGLGCGSAGLGSSVVQGDKSSILIGRTPTILRSYWSIIQSVEIFSSTERSYYSMSLVLLRQQYYAIKNQLVASKAPY